MSAEPSAIASRIDEVTVYRGAARIQRVARVTVDGRREVRLAGLPLALEDDSVRIAVRGPAIAAGVRVAVDAVDAGVVDPPDRQALDAARLRHARADVDVARLERAIADLGALAPAGAPADDEEPADWAAVVDARLAVHELAAARERELRGALAAARRERDDAALARELAEDRARRASSARRASAHQLRKALVVQLVGGGGEVELIAEYVVPGARWAPVYVARLDGGRARVELRATIAQDTGEDWDGVALALSTAAAQRFTELPELPAQRIGRRQPPARPGWRPAPIGVDALYADWDRAFAERRLPPEPAPPPPPPAEVEDVWRGDDEMRFGAPGGAADKTRLMPPPMPTAAMAMPAPAPARARAMPVVAQAARRRRATTAAAPPEPEPAARDDAALTAPAELLAYGELCMPPPTSAARGQLVRISRRERYLALLAVAELEIDVDLVARVDAAAASARAVAQLPLPPLADDAWDDAYAYAYRADGRVDVPSDRQWHQVALAARDAAIAIHHVVVPRESCDVFRLGALTSPFDAPLLPGPMDVYEGKDLLSTARIALVPPRGKIEVGLGVDQAVKTARVAEVREETAGLLRGGLKLAHSIAITVDNLGQRPVQLEIRERVPVTPDGDGGDDDVAVDVVRTQPVWESWAPEPESPGEPRLRGGHRWRIAVDPGQRRELRAEYHIKIAARHELVGGNRREP